MNGPEYYASGYHPVLAEDQVVQVDTTDLDQLDFDVVVEQVHDRLNRQIA